MSMPDQILEETKTQQTPETPAPDPTAPGAAPKPRVEVDALGGEQSVILKERLERAAKIGAEKERQRMLAEFGIADPEKYKADRAEREKRLKAYEDAEEKRKAASLSEKQRLELDLDKARKEAAQLKAKLEETEVDRMAERQDAKITSIAARTIDPDMTEEACVLLQRHASKLTPEEIAEFGEKEVEKFFKDLAKRKPQYAPRANAPKVVPKKLAGPPTSTVGQPKPAPTNSSIVTTKTPRPGQKNSMTKAEVKEFAKKQGIDYST